MPVLIKPDRKAAVSLALFVGMALAGACLESCSAAEPTKLCSKVMALEPFVTYPSTTFKPGV